MARLRLSARARQAMLSVALAVSVAGLAVSAIELSRWHPRSERSASSRSRAASASASSRPSLADDQRLVPVAPEPASSEAPKINNAPGVSTADLAAFEDAATTAPPSKYKSASELFADASQARTRGDVPTAIAISQQIERTFPNSTEGITTHLSLGVLYLERGQPSLALQELKIYRHIGASEMMAEALWGEEQAYEKLGQPNDERPVLEELLQNYPRSVYAAAAAQRLATLNHR